VLEAIAAARHRGLRTLGISGATPMNCDVDMRVPSTDTARIQECHLLLTHMLCESLDA
jgi:D-sedoheptulose 7-phosphate isomerase